MVITRVEIVVELLSRGSLTVLFRMDVVVIVDVELVLALVGFGRVGFNSDSGSLLLVPGPSRSSGVYCTRFIKTRR